MIKLQNKGWVELWDGTQFKFNDKPGSLAKVIEPEWVAVSLSRLCRYSGHTRRFYSVLEHTLIMAEWVAKQPKSTPMMVLAALHHDDAETIMGDLPRPIKQEQPDFSKLEKHLDLAFAIRFNLPTDMPSWLKDIDTRILVDERKSVMNPSTNTWTTDGMAPLGVKFRPWTSRVSRYGVRQWLLMHYKYTEMRYRYKKVPKQEETDYQWSSG